MKFADMFASYLICSGLFDLICLVVARGVLHAISSYVLALMLNGVLLAGVPPVKMDR